MQTIQWSFSSLKDFIGCPKRYQEVKVLKNFEQKFNEAAHYGNKVHEALEKYVKDSVELPANYQIFKGWVDALIALPGQKITEHRMALNFNRQPCTWAAKDMWVRGIADLLIIDGDHARIIDYKTGSERYPEPNQLKLMALLVFAHYPEVQKIDAALMFILKNVIIDESYTREDSNKLWDVFAPDLERLSLAYENNNWPANPSALCRFCPVNTCQFHKE
jgi:CRISPR/Cas system-associated exonuclease Cas4 (RecB family)